MNRLLDIGFQFAGHWLLEGDRLRVAIRQHGEQRNVLYAFVCEGEVKYVGKSTQTLRKRMAGYISPGPTSWTNQRNHKSIRSLLAQGDSVDVYALPDNGLMHYGAFHLNLAAGLEDSIIEMLAPEWNMTVKKLARSAAHVDTHEVEEQDNESDSAQKEDAGQQWLTEAASASFEFHLQRTYWNRGFFNVGVASSAMLGADGDTIEIFFGDSQQAILGTISRVANSNHTPRVFGGPALRKCFQTLPEMTNMLVQVLSPTSIRIRAKR